MAETAENYGRQLGLHWMRTKSSTLRHLQVWSVKKSVLPPQSHCSAGGPTVPSPVYLAKAAAVRNCWLNSRKQTGPNVACRATIGKPEKTKTGESDQLGLDPVRSSLED